MKLKINPLPCENINCIETVKWKTWVTRYHKFGFGVCGKHLVELFQEEIRLENLHKLNENSKN